MRAQSTVRQGIIAAVACVALVSKAADYTWDATPGSGSADDGGGTWSTSASGTNWWDGTTNLAWPNLSTDTAVFGAGSGAAGTVTVSGGVTTNGITFNAPGSGTYTLSSGTITLAGSTPTVTANVNASIGSILAGSAGLVKAGAGSLTLSASNTFTGGTQINAGTINVTNANALGSGAIAVGSSGTALFHGTGTSGYTIANAITGSGSISVRSNPGGSVTTGENYSYLTGTISGFSGTISMDPFQSVVMIGDNALDGSNAKWVVTNTQSASGYILSQTAGSTVKIGELSGNGRLGAANYGAGTTWEVGALATSSTLSGAFVNSLSGFPTSLRKVGSGTLTLTGANTATGTASIVAGTLRIGSGGSIASGIIAIGSSGTLSIAGGSVSSAVTGSSVITFAGSASNYGVITGNLGGFTGTVQADSSTNYLAINNNFLSGSNAKWVVNGSSNYLFADSATVVALGELSGSGRLSSTSGGGTVWRVGDLATSSTFSGIFQNSNFGAKGSPILRKVGSGTLTLTGSSSYTGGTQLDAGVIALGNAGALGASGTISFGGGTLQFSGDNTTNYASRILGSGSAVRLDTNGQNVAFGALGTSNTGGLAKLGGGTLTMTGASSYSGATSVEAGSLLVNGSLASTSAVNVASGATLGGSGSIAGTITGNGLVSPGNSPGILTAAQFDPSGGLDAAFELTAFSPIYTSATASLNDITRLTNLTDPFASGAFTAANVIDVYFNVGSIANGEVYEGGFFTGITAASLLAALDGTATFAYWAKTTGTPTRTFGGVGYVGLSTLPGITGATFQTATRTADFGSGNMTGSVTQFVIVPEPAALALAGIGVVIAAWASRRRR